MSHLMAQGRLRDAQFIRRALEAAMPSNRLERAQLMDQSGRQGHGSVSYA
jgi:hypothetical protein